MPTKSNTRWTRYYNLLKKIEIRSIRPDAQNSLILSKGKYFQDSESDCILNFVIKFRSFFNYLLLKLIIYK